MDEISFFFEDTSFFLTKKKQTQIKTWIIKSAKTYSYTIKHLNYIFCSDAYLLEINRLYLQHNTFTDIITFNLSEKSEEIQADIFISIERVTENAKVFRTSFSEELLRVIIHGVLHLVGYKDKSLDEKTEMSEREDFHISTFGSF